MIWSGRTMAFWLVFCANGSAGGDAFLLPRQKGMRATQHFSGKGRYLENLYVTPEPPPDGSNYVSRDQDELKWKGIGEESSNRKTLADDSKDNGDPFARLDDEMSLVSSSALEPSSSSSTSLFDGVSTADDEEENADVILNGVEQSSSSTNNGAADRSVARQKPEPRFDPNQPMMNARSRIIKRENPNLKRTTVAPQSGRSFNPEQRMISSEKMIMKHTPYLNYRNDPNGNLPNAYMEKSNPDRPMLDVSQNMIQKGTTNSNQNRGSRAPVWNGNMSHQYKETKDPNKPLMDTGKMIFHRGPTKHSNPRRVEWNTQLNNPNGYPPGQDRNGHQNRAANGVPKSQQGRRNVVPPGSSSAAGLKIQFDPSKSMIDTGDKIVKKGE